MTSNYTTSAKATDEDSSAKATMSIDQDVDSPSVVGGEKNQKKKTDNDSAAAKKKNDGVDDCCCTPTRELVGETNEDNTSGTAEVDSPIMPVDLFGAARTSPEVE